MQVAFCGMTVGILGPLVFDIDGSSRLPSAPKPRTVLALLVSNANEVVRVPTLVDELWGDSPPASARNVVQTYVVQLRKLLSRPTEPGSPSGRSILDTTVSGYRLHLPADALDRTAFEREAAAGRHALQQGNDSSGVALLRRALDLWRGPAFNDVPHGSALEAAALRLEDSRVAVLDQCIEAELRLGRHQELLGELAGLVSTHKLHENLHAQYMFALARSGRRTEALEVFHRLRHRLVEQLGMEPTPRLARLQQAILSGDPAIDSTTPLAMRALLPGVTGEHVSAVESRMAG
jgi:DNA-binding SARP family transcriptional activator